jgi:periplasmic divalent cation tolerance protein
MQPGRPSEAEPLAVLYATVPDADLAERIATVLLERRLAACVNILPGMTSLYRWQGRIERGREVVMIVKTRRACTEPAVEAIRSEHPFTVPAIVSLDVTGGLPGYLGWIVEETAP